MRLIIVVHFLMPLGLHPAPLVSKASLSRYTATPCLPQGATHTAGAAGVSAAGSCGSRAWGMEAFSSSLEQLSRALEL